MVVDYHLYFALFWQNCYAVRAHTKVTLHIVVHLAIHSARFQPTDVADVSGGGLMSHEGVTLGA